MLRLALGDLGDVMAELLVGFTGIAAATLGFRHRQHAASEVVEAVVGDAVPGLGVVAINGNLEADERAVIQLPARREQLRVDELGAGLGFVQLHGLREGVALVVAANVAAKASVTLQGSRLMMGGVLRLFRTKRNGKETSGETGGHILLPDFFCNLQRKGCFVTGG